jgi:hypothetical protein
MARALITGASGGIGKELAKVAAKNGYDTILVARSEGKLNALAEELTTTHGVAATVITSDLSLPEAPHALYEAVQAPVDVLINNAGFTVFGEFTETDMQREMAMIQVNIAALTALSKLFLPPMVERGGGYVMNVASTAAFMPGPLMAVYYATKAYVLSFSEAVNEELDGTGVSVTALAPGPTETGFQARGNMEDSKLVAGRDIMSAEVVAEAGWKAMMSRKPVIIPGFQNQMQALAPRFLPRQMVTKMVKGAQEPVGH